MSEPARRLSPDARRAQLLEAALAMLGDLSLDDLSHDEVASAVGVSKALVFHYFPSKRELHVAVVRAGAEQLLEALATDPSAGAEDRLQAGIEAFLDAIERRPRAYRAMARCAGATPELLEVYEDTRSDIVTMIVEGLEIETPPPLLETALRGWIAMAEETALHWVDRRHVPREELVALLHTAALSLLPFVLATGSGST